MTPVRRELRILTRLATPVAVTQVASMLLWTIDFLMVGRVGILELNAVALGRLWVMGIAVVAMGIVFGIDPIASQAHGARDRVRLGGTLLHGVAMALLVSVPCAAILLFTEEVLLAFGQDPTTVALAARYVRVQIPGLPFYLLFVVLQRYLQARGIVRPAMWISLWANLFHAVADALLVFGLLGAPRLGAVGAGVATALTDVVMFVALVVAMRRYRLQRGARTDLTLTGVRRRELFEIAALGLPIAFQLALEYWAFALATLWAGRLGSVDLAAHSIALNLASITYMLPLGIGLGATTRVGNLTGAGDPRGARRATWVALGLGATIMLGCALLFILLRNLIPRAFTGEAEVVARTAALLPIVAAFELFDGLQSVGGGILRGLGRTRAAAVANLVGYYALGLPLGAWLGRPERLGLAGIWWGLALGLFAVAVAVVGWIALAGARTIPLVSRAQRTQSSAGDRTE